MDPGTSTMNRAQRYAITTTKNGAQTRTIDPMVWRSRTRRYAATINGNKTVLSCVSAAHTYRIDAPINPCDTPGLRPINRISEPNSNASDSGSGIALAKTTAPVCAGSTAKIAAVSSPTVTSPASNCAARQLSTTTTTC